MKKVKLSLIVNDEKDVFEGVIDSSKKDVLDYNQNIQWTHKTHIVCDDASKGKIPEKKDCHNIDDAYHFLIKMANEGYPNKPYKIITEVSEEK